MGGRLPAQHTPATKSGRPNALAGENPFEGCTPAVPEGEKLDFGDAHFRELERAGIAAAGARGVTRLQGGDEA